MSYPIRMVSIDPSSNHVGIAVSEFDKDFNTMMVVDVTTIHLAKLVNRYEKEMMDVFSEKIAKLHILREAITKYLHAWNPCVIVSEGPYMGEFAVAYAALVESISAIRAGIKDYDPSLILNIIDPATVKKGAGVSGKSGDKELMRVAIDLKSDLTLTTPSILLDEHAIDAVLVGYCYFKDKIKKEEK